MRVLAALVLLVAALAAAEVFYKETFDSTWEKRWIPSDWKKSEGTAGTWVWSASQWYGDAEADKGIQTSQDARFFAISSKLSSKPISNEGKTLVVQFSVKFPQKIDCGGGYIKLLPSTLDQKKFSGDSDYAIMFGPDICGTSTRKVHVIFTYKGKNLLTKKDIRCETDQLTHVYTLIVRPDNTYEVLIDGVEKAKGSLYEDWDFLPPKEIPDPSKSKPSDWVDDEKIPDPEAVKPDGWDDVPATISDPDAEKPEDWDEDSDGEWEPPTIPNPEYKGEWRAPLIDNPDYKGPWIHPQIPNPEYFDDDKVYLHKDIQYVGIELWQVKSGTLFDNIIVTDDVEAAKKLRDETFFKNKDAEKKMFDDLEESKRKEEEEKRKKAEAEKPKVDDIEDDDDDIADVLDDKDEL